MSHWLHPAAEAELGDAAVYCAERASRAIAEAFLAEDERVCGLLVENRQRWPRIHAVAHQRREPGYRSGRT